MDGTEKISLALAIKDVEDRDLALQKLSKELLAEKDLEKAIGVTHFIENSYERVESLNLIAESLAKLGELKRSFWFINKAKHVTNHCEEFWQRAELLHKLAKTLYKSGETAKADILWKKAINVGRIGENSPSQQSHLDASSVLSEIIIFTAKNVDSQKALKLAQNIKNPHYRERTLNVISEYQKQVQLVA
jgi:tetratricopeptide (TPR) repeat protein